ncbi:MAG TPA: SagB/ThcOx family dehydrogenase [Candidatus Limnocylindria bacterium]|nr:SagB/ThcOx family dehydrogenase [Candidatus Limnocylindria bacterium]
MRRLRQDADWLVSVVLLASVAVTAVTGVVADVWDLNDFWYHTVAGYVMGLAAIAHVALNAGRLVAYGRFRIRRQPRQPPVTRRERHEPVSPGSLARGFLSRRGFIGLAAGTAGGWLLGRGLRPSPAIASSSDVGVIYHEWSKPGIVDALGTLTNWGRFPPLYKTYPGAPRIALPRPRVDGGPSAAQAILARRSVRHFSARPMTLEELSRVLFLASGISADSWGHARRTAPSSGALYPIELYAVVHGVEGLDRGVYHYAIREHELELIRAGDMRSAVVEQGLSQEFLGECGAVLFLTQVLQRMRPKYQDRSYRYGLLEAGHIGENAYLAATSAGLGACGVGAFMDDAINAMLGLDGVEEAAVYMLAVGHPRGA